MMTWSRGLEEGWKAYIAITIPTTMKIIGNIIEKKIAGLLTVVLNFLRKIYFIWVFIS